MNNKHPVRALQLRDTVVKDSSDHMLYDHLLTVGKHRICVNIWSFVSPSVQIKVLGTQSSFICKPAVNTEAVRFNIILYIIASFGNKLFHLLL